MKPSDMTLPDYQSLVRKLVIQRGFDKETVPEVFMLLCEESGEFAKAIRKHVGMTTDAQSQKFELAEEAADVLWLLLDLCNRLNIDLAQAFADKEHKNKTRHWA